MYPKLKHSWSRVLSRLMRPLQLAALAWLSLGLMAAADAQGTASVAAKASAAGTRAPFKVGFVYVTPIGDAGWTYQHEQGRLAMEKALRAQGIQVQSSVVASVPEGPDAERVMRDMAAQGHQLIFATSFGYLDAALKVAQDYPGVVFEHAGGYKTAPNLSTYIGRFYEARYLAGVLAGATSKSGLAGYVAGFPVPEVVQGINAFTLGMRSVNPKAQVKVLWLDSWFDPAREREATLTLIRQGADVLTHHSASPAVPATAEAERVRVIAYPSDMRHVAPHAQLAAIVHEWGGFYTRTALAVINRSWNKQPVWGSMAEGYIRLSEPAADIPPQARALLQARQAELLAGRVHPFGGRIIDTQGQVRQAGGAMPDADIQAMDWFVEGVVGGRTATR